jgi:hypothetical protein
VLHDAACPFDVSEQDHRVEQGWMIRHDHARAARSEARQARPIDVELDDADESHEAQERPKAPPYSVARETLPRSYARDEHEQRAEVQHAHDERTGTECRK